MNQLAAMSCAVRVSLSSLKAAWLQWNELQAAAADTVFQRRIDALTGSPRDPRSPDHQ
jgi:hypothetical protein